MTTGQDHSDITRLAEDLKIILLDVDGVLTDGGIILIDDAQEAKRFNVQDGMGINLAHAAGLKVGIVTSRDSAVVRRRAAELNIDDLYQGVADKPQVLAMLREKHDIAAKHAAFIGDDIQDISIMKIVGIPIAVQNAIKEVKDHSVYVTTASGGHGAVREAVDWLLELRGDRSKVLAPYLN